MKSTILTFVAVVMSVCLQAQDFTKNLATARTTYSSKKLEEARFAMQQMLQELDIIAGKDILKLLPAKLDALNANVANDNVSGNSGFAGIVIEREYGTQARSAEIQIIGNSPLLGSINAILSLPFAQSNGNQKTIKLDGYKALLQKNTDETNKINYEIQLPLSSSLLTFKVDNTTEAEIIKLAGNIPIAQIAKQLQ